MSKSLEPGSRVRLITPDNERLDGATGTVRELTEWGAFVLTEAAGAGEFRALYEEMEPLGGEEAPGERASAGNGHAPKARGAVKGRAAARESGYTGDVCDICGSFEVRRVGPCVRCDTCGASGGCG